MVKKPKLLFVNRSFWPDNGATGQLLTELCEDLSRDFQVTVLCGHAANVTSDTSRARDRFPGSGEITVRRVWQTRWSKRFFFFRLLNMLTFSLSTTIGLLRLPKPDVVVAETDPPFLCLVAWLVQRVRGYKLVCYLQDIYPDVAIAAGVVPNVLPIRILRKIFAGIYRRADRVIVPSQDMAEHLGALGIDAERVVCIRNWADTRKVMPVKRNNRFRRCHGLEDKFVVMYSGNLGMTQPWEEILRAAEQLRDDPRIMIILVGQGAARQRLVRQVAERNLTNVRFVDFQPYSKLAETLSAADVHLVPLDPRFERFLMPSKIYGVLASGTAALVVASPSCELARICRDCGVGVVVASEDVSRLAETIKGLKHEPEILLAMGQRARELATSRFDRQLSSGQFGRELKEVLGIRDENAAPRGETRERVDV